MYFKWALFYLNEIKNNFRSGATVALVSVPLSISLAIAGGASPVSGIVAGFYCGLFGSLFGGSEFNIIGPTGALSGLLASAATAYNPLILPLLGIYGGLLCLLVWAFDLVGYLMVIPSSVVHGFTLGVAFIIGLEQLDFALGLEIHHDRSLDFAGKILDSLNHIHEITSPISFIFFLINFIILTLLVNYFPKIPWNINLCIFGAIIGYMGVEHHIWPASELITLGQHFAGVNWSLELFTLPQWNNGLLTFSAFSDAMSIAFISILETLISARMADEMHGKTHHDRNKEVLGLGIANIVGGFFGGIPSTAALARTSLNVQSGATSRISGVINAFMLIILSKLLLPYFSYLPMTTIAAMLTLVAVKMCSMKHLGHLYTFERRQFYIAIFTALLCVLVDTMSGLVIGSILSLIIYAQNLSHGMAEMQIFSYTPSTSFGTTDTNKVFLAEVHVEVLDNYSLGDHIVHLFTEYRHKNWGNSVKSPMSIWGAGGGGNNTPRGISSSSNSSSSSGYQHISSNTPFSSEPSSNSHASNMSGKNADACLDVSERAPLMIALQQRAYTRAASRSVVGDNLTTDSKHETLLPLIISNTGYVIPQDPVFFIPLPTGKEYAIVYRIAGQFTYVNGLAHVQRAERTASRVNGFRTVVISMRTVWTIDLDGVDSLNAIIKIFSDAGLVCILDGVSRIQQALAGHAFFEDIVQSGRCVEKWTQMSSDD